MCTTLQTSKILDIFPKCRARYTSMPEPAQGKYLKD